ncbi:MAG TPA: SHOCT domain-containing protein [Candidatus Saccharimonadales bacterium]|nr:SHOCT domain-containing protein [Candidatus Saccharimonadales bacterium]
MYYYDHQMMDGWNGNSPWGWLFGLLMMVLFVLVAVLVLRYLAREWHKGNDGKSGETAMDILQKRYAAGEIDKKEYDEKRKDLKD